MKPAPETGGQGKISGMDEKMLQSITDSIVDELHPEEVILFGSRAAGTNRPGSDIDLLIVLADSDETTRGRRRLTGRAYRRLASYPVAKDILIYSRAEVERWQHVQGYVIARGLSEGRRLYGKA